MIKLSKIGSHVKTNKFRPSALLIFPIFFVFSDTALTDETKVNISNKSKRDFQPYASKNNIERHYAESILEIYKNSFSVSKNRNLSKHIKGNCSPPLNVSSGPKFTLSPSLREESYKNWIAKNNGFGEKLRDLSFLSKIDIEREMLSISLLEAPIFLHISGILLTRPPETLAAQTYLGEDGNNNIFDKGKAENNFRDLNNNVSSPNLLFEDASRSGRAGQQVLYVGKYITTLKPFRDVNIALEQSYYLSVQRNHNGFQQIDHYLSDYVGHVETHPFSWINLGYHFGLNQKSLRPNFYEFGVRVGPPFANLSGSYVIIQNHTNPCDSKNTTEVSPFMLNGATHGKHINFLLNSQITDSLFLTGSLMQGVQKKKRAKNTYQYGIGSHYRTGFFTLSLTASRQFYPEITPKPETRFMLTFTLNGEGDYISPMPERPLELVHYHP